MLQRISLTLFAICLLLSGCKHGPNTTPLFASSGDMTFSGDNSKGVSTSVPFIKSLNYKVYNPQHYQTVFDYCEARFGDPVLPTWDRCKSDGASGVNCIEEKCAIDSSRHQLICNPGVSYFLSFNQIDGFVAFSPPEDQTILDYCGIVLQGKQ